MPPSFVEAPRPNLFGISWSESRPCARACCFAWPRIANVGKFRHQEEQLRRHDQDRDENKQTTDWPQQLDDVLKQPEGRIDATERDRVDGEPTDCLENLNECAVQQCGG